MMTVDERTTLVGISEVRTASTKILQALKKGTVILTKRNRPIGVVLEYDEYQKMERLVEALEDTVLGAMAEEREKQADRSKYLSHAKMKKLVGLTR